MEVCLWNTIQTALGYLQLCSTAARIFLHFHPLIFSSIAMERINFEWKYSRRSISFKRLFAIARFYFHSTAVEISPLIPFEKRERVSTEENRDSKGITAAYPPPPSNHLPLDIKEINLSNEPSQMCLKAGLNNDHKEDRWCNDNRWREKREK